LNFRYLRVDGFIDLVDAITEKKTQQQGKGGQW